MIIGENGEYINKGLTEHFTSPPTVPEYIYTMDNLNQHMVETIKTHVDLYHCDVRALKQSRNQTMDLFHSQS